MGRKKKTKIPAHLVAASLRPRMDTAWQNEFLPRQSQASICATLDRLAHRVKKDFFASTLLRAFFEAPVTNQERLSEVLPIWLKKRGYVKALKSLVVEPLMESELQEEALTWLEAAGIEVNSIKLTQMEDLFYDAYMYDDTSQASLTMMWYTNRHRNRADGLSFLIDYNPPWEGAVKDVIHLPTRSPKRLITELEEIMTLKLKRVSAQEAKRLLVAALECNYDFEIRLPKDLIRERDYFAERVIRLPDTPETQAFSMKNFDELSRTGKRPESMTHFEQNFGRRVRMDDGKEVVVMGAPWDDEEKEFWS